MAVNWTAKPYVQRGRILKFGFTNPGAFPAGANDAGLDFTAGAFAAAGGAAYFGPNLAAGQNPSAPEIRAFKQMIYQNYREYIDRMGWTIAAPDESVGILGGRLPDLTEQNNVGFVNTAPRGDSLSSSARETGLEKEDFKRDNTQKAIINPDEYIKAANADLKSNENKALEVFQTSFRKYYDEYKYSAEEAKQMATEDMKVYLGLLMKQHKVVYNNDLFTEASKRIYKNA